MTEIHPIISKHIKNNVKQRGLGFLVVDFCDGAVNRTKQREWTLRLVEDLTSGGLKVFTRINRKELCSPEQRDIRDCVICCAISSCI